MFEILKHGLSLSEIFEIIIYKLLSKLSYERLYWIDRILEASFNDKESGGLTFWADADVDEESLDRFDVPSNFGKSLEKV